jgi:hypothetical protein
MDIEPPRGPSELAQDRAVDSWVESIAKALGQGHVRYFQHPNR